MPPPNYLRLAWTNTLHDSAGGTALAGLGEYYGLPKPGFMSPEAFRRFLGASAEAYRGLPNPTQFALEGALSDFATTLTVTLDPSRPSQLVSASAEFTQALVGRWVRIPAYGLFMVSGPADMAASATPGEVLDLATRATSYWQAPDWSTLPGQLNVEAEFLAFYVVEDQAGPGQTNGDVTGTVTVYLWPDVIEGVPPTFMLPYDESIGPLDPADYPTVVSGAVPYVPIIGDPPDNRPAGQPYGGILLADATAESGIASGEGPFALYLASDDSLPGLVETFQDALTAPIKMRILRLPTVEIP